MGIRFYSYFPAVFLLTGLNETQKVLCDGEHFCGKGDHSASAGRHAGRLFLGDGLTNSLRWAQSLARLRTGGTIAQELGLESLEHRCDTKGCTRFSRESGSGPEGLREFGASGSLPFVKCSAYLNGLGREYSSVRSPIRLCIELLEFHRTS